MPIFDSQLNVKSTRAREENPVCVCTVVQYCSLLSSTNELAATHEKQGQVIHEDEVFD